MDLRLGDCMEVLASLPANCVDSIVADLPYDLVLLAARKKVNISRLPRKELYMSIQMNYLQGIQHE